MFPETEDPELATQAVLIDDSLVELIPPSSLSNTGRGGASFNFQINEILLIFRVSFLYFEMFYAFVLRF